MIVFRAIDSVANTSNKTCADSFDSIDIIGSLSRISGTGATTGPTAMKHFGSIYDIHYIQVPKKNQPPFENFLSFIFYILFDVSLFKC